MIMIMNEQITQIPVYISFLDMSSIHVYAKLASSANVIVALTCGNVIKCHKIAHFITTLNMVYGFIYKQDKKNCI